jgi:hypothetical protein
VWLRAACCHKYCRARLNLKLAPNGDWTKFDMVELIAAGLWASSVVWLLAGGSIFGPLGLLMAIPAAVTVKVTREAVLAPAPGAADLHREAMGRSRRS